MQCGHGIPECPAYGYVSTEDVGKVGGTGNMGSMVDIWGNEKKRETRSLKKDQVPTLRENFSWVGKRGRGRAAVEVCELFSGSGSS